jgi:hypothetical protein
MLQLARSLLWALGSSHSPIYIQRQRLLWDVDRSRTVRADEFIDIPLLYRDITWLFESALARGSSASRYASDGVAAFSALVLLRGDDYAQQLGYCTIKALWRCFFEYMGDCFIETPVRDGRYESEPRRWLTHALPLRIHFDALRAFVNRAYDTVKEERSETRSTNAAAKAAASGGGENKEPAKKRPMSAAALKKAAEQKPAGWPDDTRLQVMAANMIWNLDNLCNGWRPLQRAEDELQTRECPRTGEALSMYGWERRLITAPDDDGDENDNDDNTPVWRVVYAERVWPRSTFVVEHGVKPVQIKHD